jgi:acyl-CoA thioester hydrolase
MTTDATKDWTLEQFPARAYDKLRFADTDRQGHVNNAVFSTLIETGRVELIYDPQAPLAAPGTSFVIASLNLQLRAEIHWPGIVDIGTAVARVGNSSMQLYQGLFQNGVCCATAETVIVCVDDSTQKSTPLPDSARRTLAQYQTAEKKV